MTADWMYTIGLSVRACNVLTNQGWLTPEVVRALGDIDILRAKNAGRRVLAELRARGLRPDSCPGLRSDPYGADGCLHPAGHQGEHERYESPFARPIVLAPRRMPVQLTNDEFFVAAISVVRYALGRMTYAVGEAVSFVRRVWPELGTDQRSVVIRDVREALRRAEAAGGAVGMACDHVDWAKLLEWMEERP